MKPENVKQNVGIDISKDTFSFCVSTLNSKFEINYSVVGNMSNTLEGFGKLLQWVLPQIDNTLPVRFTMEGYLKAWRITFQVMVILFMWCYPIISGNMQTVWETKPKRMPLIPASCRAWVLNDHWINQGSRI